MITTVFYLDKKIVTTPGKIQHIGCNAVGKADNIFAFHRTITVVNGILAEEAIMIENGILAETFTEDIGIRTVFTFQVIITRPTDQGVAVAPSIQMVVTRPADQGVVTVTADQSIIAFIAIEYIVAVIAVERIVTATTVERICTIAPIQIVVAQSTV